MTIPMKIEKIRYCQYATMIKDAKALAHDKFGQSKVFLTPDQKIIKIFPVSHFLKELFSSRMKRFLKIVAKLKHLHISTISPEACYRSTSPSLNIIVYPYIEGSCLRDALQQNIELLRNFSHFLAHLHRFNVYFRGIHLGNVVIDKKQHFTLIDVGNTKFKVNLRRRAKNIVYILKYYADTPLLQKYGIARFINEYLQAAQLTTREEKIFKKNLRRYLNG